MKPGKSKPDVLVRVPPDCAVVHLTQAEFKKLKKCKPVAMYVSLPTGHFRLVLSMTQVG